MRRATERSSELLDLDALVLAEIASLGQERLADPADTGSDTSCNQRNNGYSRSPATPRTPTAHDDRHPQYPARYRSGEEAEGLFDGFCESEDTHGDLAADGPTAADLLTPEEQAFVTRSVGFLSRRANADLILDRIWSQALLSRPDGCYDPDSTEAWPQAQPESRSSAEKPDRGPEHPAPGDADGRPSAQPGEPSMTLASESAMAPSSVRPNPVVDAAVGSTSGQPRRRPYPTPVPSPDPMPRAESPLE